MNIIEAWKLATDGQGIRRSLSGKNGITFIKRSEVRDSLYQSLTDGRDVDDSIPDCVLLAPDWEVVKEPTHGKIETTWSDITPLISPFVTCKYDFPKDAKVTIEWGER